MNADCVIVPFHFLCAVAQSVAEETETQACAKLQFGRGHSLQTWNICPYINLNSAHRHVLEAMTTKFIEHGRENAKKYIQ